MSGKSKKETFSIRLAIPVYYDNLSAKYIHYMYMCMYLLKVFYIEVYNSFLACNRFLHTSHTVLKILKIRAHSENQIVNHSNKGHAKYIALTLFIML